MSTVVRTFMITAYDDENDYAYDLVVRAVSPQQALELWRDSYNISALDTSDCDKWLGDFVYGMPGSLEPTFESTARVWEVVIEDPNYVGPLPWAGDKISHPNNLTLVGYVVP